MKRSTISNNKQAIIAMALLIPAITGGSELAAQTIAAGDHSFANCVDGSVLAWGANSHGQLGTGNTVALTLPMYVEGLTNITSIKSSFHSLAMRSDGSVLSWGLNDHGQLGDGTLNDRNVPGPVYGVSNVVAISAGWYHSMALLADGTVWSWGGNVFGQLGDSTQFDAYAPVPVYGLTNIIAIDGGYYHSLALADDGTVWSWGTSYAGVLLGDTSSTDQLAPVQVAVLTDVVAISAGITHSLALKSDGTVWSWGDNYYWQLGDGTSQSHAQPVQVSALTDVVAIEAGQWHSVALKSDGTVWSWGDNSDKQIGDGTTTDRIAPVQVPMLENVTAIATGLNHTIARTNDGALHSWGLNNNGELGIGFLSTNACTCEDPATLGDPCALSTGLDDSPSAFDVRLYPNPASGMFTILGVRADDLVEVRNASGQVVRRMHVQGGSTTLDLTGLQRGVHTVTLRSTGRSIVRKVIML